MRARDSRVLGRAEAMLIAQVHTPEAMCNALDRRAGRAEYLDKLKTKLRGALKAQDQCISTLESKPRSRFP
jgi:hypothetical protein